MHWFILTRLLFLLCLLCSLSFFYAAAAAGTAEAPRAAMQPPKPKWQWYSVTSLPALPQDLFSRHLKAGSAKRVRLEKVGLICAELVGKVDELCRSDPAALARRGAMHCPCGGGGGSVSSALKSSSL